MTKFTANSIFTDASELEDLIFNKGQLSVNRDLNDFVEQFETKEELLPLDSLAKTYVGLTSCDQKLKSAASNSSLTATLDKLTAVQHDLTQVLESVHERQKAPLPFEAEREAYLQQREERKKIMEAELRRESDKLDEYYTKKTRESIYRNLVGGNSWLSQ